MSASDDLQKLWQNEKARPEDARMWRDLIQEKRSGWDELVRTEDQGWYLTAVCLGLAAAWAAWKAKYPWVHVGYGVMAATIVLSAVVTWIAGRRRREEHNRNLREHLEALIGDYDRRRRFLTRWGWPAMVALCAGMAGVILGIPGNAGNPGAWAITVLLAAGAVAGQALYGRHNTRKISRKRDEAARLLESLLAGGGSAR
jgi:hypothetical protein